MSYKLVCAKIKTARLESGVSLCSLAKSSSVSKGNLSKIENRGMNISVDTLLKLANALGIKPAKLLP